MENFRITTRNTELNYSMNEPHAHNFYEIYVVLNGTRELYYEDKVIHVPSKHFCVIPPFSLHKTEGGPHRRINVVLPKSLLSHQEIVFLNECTQKGAIAFEKDFHDLCIQLLSTASKLDELETENGHSETRDEYMRSIIKSFLYYMQNQTLQSNAGETIDAKNTLPPIISQIINYMHEHYMEKIDLNVLAKHFFISKTTLCHNFKKFMNCTLMTYLQRLRVNKAMDLLLYTNYHIERISDKCGFSSSAYFRFIFKKETGVSPSKYRP